MNRLFQDSQMPSDPLEMCVCGHPYSLHNSKRCKWENVYADDSLTQAFITTCPCFGFKPSGAFKAAIALALGSKLTFSKIRFSVRK